MKYKTKHGKTEVTLDKKHFIARGGEGEIYAKGGVVYKICEPGKMIPEGKFSELAVLTDPHIVRPEDILLEGTKQVGYTLKFIDNAYTLCQLFTKAFRVRNNVGPDAVLKLVQQMQDTIQSIHRHRILLVDLNELNFLLSDDFKDVYFIDVNSYQTPSFPATAIMDSIRDRHCNNVFSEGTDWFSFAIVSFQMFIGIHPYKGKHPAYTDPRTALDGRMRANLSVLNPAVSYPQAACQPLSVVPGVYLDWYKAVLEEGKRVAPPFNLTAAVLVVAAVKHLAGSNTFDMEKLREYAEAVSRYYYHNGTEAVIGATQVAVNRHVYPLPNPAVKNVGFTARNSPVAAWVAGEKLHLYDLERRAPVPVVCEATKIMDYGGRLYIQNGMRILEVLFTEAANTVLASPHVVGTCMEKNVTFYDGVVVQTLFDAYYVSVFPASKECRQFAVRELAGYKIVDAKYDNHVLMIVGVSKAGEYDRFVLRFAPDWSGYDVRKEADITHAGLNFTVLDTGVCVCLNENEDIEIFRSQKGQGGVKVYTDPAIKGDMQMARQGSQAIFTRGKELYKISVRSST